MFNDCQYRNNTTLIRNSRFSLCRINRLCIENLLYLWNNKQSYGYKTIHTKVSFLQIRE